MVDEKSTEEAPKRRRTFLRRGASEGPDSTHLPETIGAIRVPVADSSVDDSAADGSFNGSGPSDSAGAQAAEVASSSEEIIEVGGIEVDVIVVDVVEPAVEPDDVPAFVDVIEDAPSAEAPADPVGTDPALVDAEALDLTASEDIDRSSLESDAAVASESEQPAASAEPAFVAPLSPLQLLFKAPPVFAQVDVDEAPPVDPIDDGSGQQQSASSRRRSRRRSGGSPDAPDEVSVRETTRPVQRPRVVEEITEPQRVRGSTRLEAKKQRRRDGRDAGRRRTVITEAEFLARRESVDRTMVVRSSSDKIEIGVLEDGVLAEHYVAKSQNVSLIGNVYLGRVQNVLPSMEAAFVDIGRGRNAVLYSGEVDWEAAAAEGEKNQPRRIELALKPGDRVLVQVTKDPVGHKGARLTSQVSLPGRYLVYVPNGSMSGISRKLPDIERARLKRILKEVLPEGVGVIVRTAAEGATEEQLTVDVKRLTAQWESISGQLEKAQAPALLHSEPDLLVKIIRDVFNEDFARLVIAGEEAQSTIGGYLGAVAPDLLERVEKYEGSGDVFAAFRVQEQIDKALDRKVWLPSGGSLVIDRTEAMTVVDVNTGKFVGSGGNLEETVTKNNLEAAEEIVRQLRLRDIGGIIVIDFIDMVLENNRDLVLRRLVECLSRDRTKHQVAEVTSLGLVQMTRKKLGLGLAESFVENTGKNAEQPRPQSQQQGDSRRRNGNGNGNGNGKQSATPPRPAAGSTHSITDDARNALAKIAASTLHKDAVESELAAEHGNPPATEAAPQRVVFEPVSEAATPESVSEAIIALPEASFPEIVLPELALPEVAPPAPRAKAADANSLLEGVLDALPEPKKPGQGRSRSRRVSTAILTPDSKQ
ncbi:Rne/Rng family ribonuclease [Naasia lichenicola]|uniref:Ribonuclease E n=1 Tax=Naasia lichenicola TaxID=2565933 RepID=A0A4V3WSM7_9MICO|nr:Rne/Rng family ribonuclease [Naasia lichenicola]THG28687.1 Rne/Rng family ribonuclease [Naasia lichenicola]